MTGIVAAPQTKQMLMFHTLCAAAGLRFGEALGIDLKYISSDCSTITICQKAWRGQIHSFLKSNAAKREVDLHSSIAAMLKEFIGERAAGLLFASRTGKQLCTDEHPASILASHSRRFGLERSREWMHKDWRSCLPSLSSHLLRKNNVPKDLEHFWMGHDDEEIGDIYSKLKQDVAFRKEVAERIGVGFELPSKNLVVGPNGLKPEVGDVELLAVNP